MINIKKKALFALPLTVFVILMILFFKNTEAEVESGFSQVNSDEPETEEPFDTTDNQASQDNMAVVDIKGAVKNPGIYEISLDKRVDDVLQLAGGFTKNANAITVNRAAKVYDEMVIIVPEEGNEATMNDSTNSSDKIRINHATQEEIESLSGIGPSKADAIIQYREENGPFKKEDDLLEVSGIGEKTLENFKDDIIVP